MNQSLDRQVYHSRQDGLHHVKNPSSPDESSKSVWYPFVMNKWLAALKTWARSTKRDIVALWIAAHDPRTPMAAKIVAGAVAAYALSPIDLIPDFIPVLGYLDDLLIVPIGIIWAVRLISEKLMSEFRMLAEQRAQRPTSRKGLVAILAIWIAFFAVLAWILRRELGGR